MESVLGHKTPFLRSKGRKLVRKRKKKFFFLNYSVNFANCKQKRFIFFNKYGKMYGAKEKKGKNPKFLFLIITKK
jgi:hypothetical protein